MGFDVTYLGLARKIATLRHPNASAVFWGGSLSRGEGTPTSDIDLVVVYDHLPNAWRDSFFVDGQLFETFVHDPRSLEIFFLKDAERGVPSLIHMIAEGISLIPGDVADTLQAAARRRLAAGPRPWTQEELDRSRYGAGDLIDDLAGATDPTEIRAIGAALFSLAFVHHRRSNGKWAATGKTIVRRLRSEEGPMGKAYLSAFDDLFQNGSPSDVIRIVTELYAPSGGVLSVWRNDAPPSAM